MLYIYIIKVICFIKFKIFLKNSKPEEQTYNENTYLQIFRRKFIKFLDQRANVMLFDSRFYVFSTENERTKILGLIGKIGVLVTFKIKEYLR